MHSPMVRRGTSPAVGLHRWLGASLRAIQEPWRFPRPLGRADGPSGVRGTLLSCFLPVRCLFCCCCGQS